MPRISKECSDYREGWMYGLLLIHPGMSVAEANRNLGVAAATDPKLRGGGMGTARFYAIRTAAGAGTGVPAKLSYRAADVAARRQQRLVEKATYTMPEDIKPDGGAEK